MDNTYASAPQIGPRLGRPGRRGAGRGRPDPARGVLLLRASPTTSARCARCGPATSASSRRSTAAVVTCGAAAVTINRIDDAGIDVLRRGRQGLLPRQLAAARRTTCSPTCDDGRRRRPSSDAGPPGRLPAVGQRGGPPAGPAGDDDRGVLRRRPHHELDASTAAATSTRTPTPAPATSSRPTPCWCCGSRSATPATATRPATRCPRPSSTGKGQAMIFHDGRLVRGTWARAASTRRSRCRPRPATLTVPAGHTWIELVPAATADVTFAEVALRRRLGDRAGRQLDAGRRPGPGSRRG